jgi:hypothetical protein
MTADSRHGGHLITSFSAEENSDDLLDLARCASVRLNRRATTRACKESTESTEQLAPVRKRSWWSSPKEAREFAGHDDIRTTGLYFVRKEEDVEVAARKIGIRVVRPEPKR